MTIQKEKATRGCNYEQSKDNTKTNTMQTDRDIRTMRPYMYTMTVVMTCISVETMIIQYNDMTIHNNDNQNKF